MSEWQTILADELVQGDIVTLGDVTEAVKKVMHAASGHVFISREGLPVETLLPDDQVEVYR